MSRALQHLEEVYTRSESLKPIYSKNYKSLKTSANEQQSQSTSILKKYSINFTNKKRRIKTQANQSFGSSVVLSSAKKGSQLIKLPSIKLKSQYSSVLTIEELTDDPHLDIKLRQQKINKLKNPENQSASALLKQIANSQQQYLTFCSEKKYNEAQKILQKFLNFSIDLNLIKYFAAAIVIIGDFHFACNNLQQCFFYYNQAKYCYQDMGQYQQATQSLIKLSKCTNRLKMYQQSIRILKKGLEYAWFFRLESSQLIIYDEIGKCYYLMGDVQNAKKFHFKYYSCLIQPNNSAIRLLSKQSLILEGINNRRIDTEITKLFIIKLSVPIKQYTEISKFPSLLSNGLRGQYCRDPKYCQILKSIKSQIVQLFQNSSFKNQIGQIHIQETDWTIPIRLRKFLSIDISRNKHLRGLGIDYKNYFKKDYEINQMRKQSILQSNQSIDEQCAKMVKYSIRNIKSNGQGFKKRVQLRGSDKISDFSISAFRILYNKFFI